MHIVEGYVDDVLDPVRKVAGTGWRRRRSKCGGWAQARAEAQDGEHISSRRQFHELNSSPKALNIGHRRHFPSGLLRARDGSVASSWPRHQRERDVTAVEKLG